jgi:DNA-binding NarL/FixJ family response regulator
VTCKVAVFEDDAGYRAALALLLGTLPRFALVEEHATPRAAVEAIERGAAPAWDLALMDLEMPDLDGITATRRIKAALPERRVVVITAFDDPPRVLAAICAGADGYLVKRASHAEVADALHAVLDGGAPLTSAVAKTVLDLLRDKRIERYAGEPLSPREQQVLSGFVGGRSYKEIASDLGITIDTVRTYVRTLYKKLQVHSVAAAVTQALRLGLV